jgi:hypothetical protein
MGDFVVKCFVLLGEKLLKKVVNAFWERRRFEKSPVREGRRGVRIGLLRSLPTS